MADNSPQNGNSFNAEKQENNNDTKNDDSLQENKKNIFIKILAWCKCSFLHPVYCFKNIFSIFFLFLKYLILLLRYFYLYLFKLIKINFIFFCSKNIRINFYLMQLSEIWRDEYNHNEDRNLDKQHNSSSDIVNNFFQNNNISAPNYKIFAEYFFDNNMFSLANIFYSKYYSNMFCSKRYYYKAICLIEAIKYEYMYRRDKQYIVNLYLNILGIIALFYLAISLLFCKDSDDKFNIYKNLGSVYYFLNFNKKAECYFKKAKKIHPKNSLILNNLAFFYYIKDVNKNTKLNMFKSIKFILSAMKYSTEYNREMVYRNLTTILKYYQKNINIDKYKNIVYKLKFNNLIYCIDIANDYKDISEKETLYCIKQVSNKLIKNLSQHISNYRYLMTQSIPIQYLNEYKYYMTYSTYIVFCHLDTLKLINYFLLEDVKLPSKLKEVFINILKGETK